MIDNNVKSIWSEGADGAGIGEWIELSSYNGEVNISKIKIVNGLATNQEKYYYNNRVKQDIPNNT